MPRRPGPGDRRTRGGGADPGQYPCRCGGQSGARRACPRQEPAPGEPGRLIVLGHCGRAPLSPVVARCTATAVLCVCILAPVLRMTLLEERGRRWTADTPGPAARACVAEGPPCHQGEARPRRVSLPKGLGRDGRAVVARPAPLAGLSPR